MRTPVLWPRVDAKHCDCHHMDQGALWSLSLEDSRSSMGAAAAPCLHATQSRDVMGLRQLKEVRLQL